MRGLRGDRMSISSRVQGPKRSQEPRRDLVKMFREDRQREQTVTIEIKLEICYDI